MKNTIFLIIIFILSILLALSIYTIYIVVPIDNFVDFDFNNKSFYKIIESDSQVKFITYTSNGELISEDIYDFSEDNLTKLTKVVYHSSILQAKIADKEDNIYNSSTTHYREKNKIMVEYTAHELYGQNKTTVIDYLNTFIYNATNALS